jgi:hypothetical protein
LKQSEQNSSKAWQDRENNDFYLKFCLKFRVEVQHPEVQTHPVPEFIDLVLGMKTSISVKTSQKLFFSFQTLLKVVIFILY